MELPPVVSVKETPLPEGLLVGLPLALSKLLPVVELEGLIDGLPLGMPKLEPEPVVSVKVPSTIEATKAFATIARTSFSARRTFH